MELPSCNDAGSSDSKHNNADNHQRVSECFTKFITENIPSSSSSSSLTQKDDISSLPHVLSESLKNVIYLLTRLLVFSANNGETIEKKSLTEEEYLQLAVTLANVYKTGADDLNVLRDRFTNNVNEWCDTNIATRRFAKKTDDQFTQTSERDEINDPPTTSNSPGDCIPRRVSAQSESDVDSDATVELNVEKCRHVKTETEPVNGKRPSSSSSLDSGGSAFRQLCNVRKESSSDCASINISFSTDCEDNVDTSLHHDINERLPSVSLVPFDNEMFLSTLNSKDAEFFLRSKVSLYRKRALYNKTRSTDSSDDSDSPLRCRTDKRKKLIKKKRISILSSPDTIIFSSSDESNFDDKDENADEVHPYINSLPSMDGNDSVISGLDDNFSDSDETFLSFTENAKENVTEYNVEPKVLNQNNKPANATPCDNGEVNWRNDTLLKERLTDTPKSVQNESKKSPENITYDIPEGSKDILAKEIFDKIKKRQERLEINKDGHSDSDKTNSIHFGETTEDSGDDSSEIEFFEPIVEKNCEDSIVIDSNSSDDNSGTHTQSKKGRRNIKAVLSDDELDEATAKARKEEKDRLERLTQLQESRDHLSQTIVDPAETLVLDVDVETKRPLVSVEPVLVQRLKDHQKDGVKFMWNACFESVAHLKMNSGSGCILAHTMGLGKSFQIVTLIHTLFMHPITNVHRALIVCPLSTVLNWDNEFKIGLEKSKNEITVSCIGNKQKNLLDKIGAVESWFKNAGVLLMGYECFISLIKERPNRPGVNFNTLREALCDPGPDLLVCDEGHNLKNGKTNRYDALMKVKTKRKIILTGTPLQNNLLEYFHMVEYVKPRLLGSSQEFSNRFINPIRNGQYEDSTGADITLMKYRSHILHQTLKGTVQRYEKSELGKYIPDKTDYVLFIKLHPVQVELYKKYREYFVNEQNLGSLLHHRNNMQKIWTHPRTLLIAKLTTPRRREQDVIIDADLFEDGIGVEESSADWWRTICPDDFATNAAYGTKMKIMLDIISECERCLDKVIIFSRLHGTMDTIEYFLKNVGTPNCPNWRKNEDYYRMDGHVPPFDRHNICIKFNNENNSRGRVLILSRGVGGLGLNLIGANRVILMDVDFNPSIDAQSVMRIYRFGQTKSCYVYRLVAMGTMEEVIYERCITKLAVAGRVVDEKQITRHFKQHEIKAMYRCKLNYDERQPPLKLPSDSLLTTVLDRPENQIFKYIEHQALLENLPDEKLDEAQVKDAWREYRQCQDSAVVNQSHPISSAQGQYSSSDAPSRTEHKLPETLKCYTRRQAMQSNSSASSSAQKTLIRPPPLIPFSEAFERRKSMNKNGASTGPSRTTSTTLFPKNISPTEGDNIEQDASIVIE